MKRLSLGGLSFYDPKDDTIWFPSNCNIKNLKSKFTLHMQPIAFERLIYHTIIKLLIADKPL